jgi:RNA recognition motif-containing protein
MIVAVDEDLAEMITFYSSVTIVPLLTMLLPTSENIGNPCAVYAGNLSWSTTEEQLLSFAGADRGAISAEIKRHKDTKRSKGWGYGSN